MSGSRKYPTEVFLIDESIDPEEFIIATYALYGNPKDYLTLTGALAIRADYWYVGSSCRGNTRVAEKTWGKSGECF